MPDVTPETLRSLARLGGMTVLDEDVEELAVRLSARLEALEALDDFSLDGVSPLLTLPHPRELPPGRRPSRQAPPIDAETDAPLAYKPITELAHLVRTRQLSPVELTRAYLDRIDRFDGDLKSYITVTAEQALQAAQQAERDLSASDPLGPLHGIPLAHKDEFYTRGVRTTCGSAVLSEFVPDYDAAAVARLRGAGAILLGKLNMTEWATPLTLEFPYGQPRNPWDLQRDAGGSSTGSGIAVAAGLCAGSLGEDTGGSIRRPAAHNSCVGLRPSWGRVSMHGVIPGVWYHDTVGPLTRTVADCALLMSVIAGHDPNDPSTAELPVPDYASLLDGDIKGMRVGVVAEMQEAEHVHPEVRAAVEAAAQQFERLGAEVEPVSIPLTRHAGVYSGIFGAERPALLWTTLKQRSREIDQATRLYILFPSFIPASFYQRALQFRNLVRQQVLDACQRYDVILSPCQISPPPLIADTKKTTTSREQALAEVRRYSFSTAATQAGVPALSVPCGFTSDGLPIGLQIVGKRFDEATVFQAAHAYEQATPWHAMRPPVGNE